MLVGAEGHWEECWGCWRNTGEVLGVEAILNGIQERFPEPGALQAYQPILTSPWRLSSCVLNSALARS